MLKCVNISFQLENIIFISTLCSKKSDAKIQITITTANLIRINYPFSSLIIAFLAQTCKFQQNPPHGFLATAF